jgi:hypothetical protein
MTFALVAVQDPEQDAAHEANQRWMSFLAASANTLKKAKASETLAQNLWLLDLNSDMHILSLLVDQSARHNFPCRTLFFDQKPLFCVS